MAYKMKTYAEVPREAFIDAVNVADILSGPIGICKKTKIVIEYDPEAEKTRIDFYEESTSETSGRESM